MFTPRQYRDKAVGYGELVKTANGPDERRELQALEQSFAGLLITTEAMVAELPSKNGMPLGMPAGGGMGF